MIGKEIALPLNEGLVQSNDLGEDQIRDRHSLLFLLIHARLPGTGPP